ncbi:MAG: DEAD/DEAH box helicase [Marinilabiliaceae bacterium]|mgnify:CR=1 FL=1|nr:DEAD/DEAH box helicase [Marinilabiliaceae bacterium]
MKFNAFGLSETLLSNIEAMGYRKPTDIQYKAIRPILSGDDVLAIAQTGTGKTAAFGIPAVELLLRNQRRLNYSGVRCIIMEPTHELAQQTGHVLCKLAAKTGIKVLSVYGGVEQDPQIEQLNSSVDVVIATPGRLFDLLSQGYLNMQQCGILILDEADHMLDLGFIDDIRQLVRKLPKWRQTLFFSATINEKIKKLAYSIVNKPVNIRISPKDMVSRNVTHSVLSVSMDEKRFYLERIAKEHPDDRIIVFVRTRVRAERVLQAMTRVGLKAVAMHGNKDQKERNRALEQFRNNEVQILVATDVTARGIDIPSVPFVVNYDVPDVAENYVHRVGRTGRGMDKGYAITFYDESEKDFLEAVEDFIGTRIDRMVLDYEEREATIDFSADAKYDWRSLIDDEK